MATILRIIPILSTLFVLIVSSDPEKTSWIADLFKTAPSSNENAEKAKCLWRKSCYANGTRPKLRPNLFLEITTEQVNGSNSRKNYEENDTAKTGKNTKGKEREGRKRHHKMMGKSDGFSTGKRKSRQSRFEWQKNIERIERIPYDIDTKKMKLECRYRKSCYSRYDIENEQRATNSLSLSLLSKKRNSNYENKEEKVKSYSVAKKVVHNVKDAEKEVRERNQAVFRPMEQTGQKLREKNLCHYRKSCYETGIVPKLESHISLDMFRIKEAEERPNPDEKLKFNGEMLENSEQGKLHCRYRKSCYETGIVPNFGTQEERRIEISQIKNNLNYQIPLQIRCRYRKSCYETGELSEEVSTERNDLNAKNRMLKVLPTSVEDLKTYCHYKKSCYEKTAHQPQEWKNEKKQKKQAEEDKVELRPYKKYQVKNCVPIDKIEAAEQKDEKTMGTLAKLEKRREVNDNASAEYSKLAKNLKEKRKAKGKIDANKLRQHNKSKERKTFEKSKSTPKFRGNLNEKNASKAKKNLQESSCLKTINKEDQIKDGKYKKTQIGGEKKIESGEKQKVDNNGKMDEAGIKMKCRYRISCYKMHGIKHKSNEMPVSSMIAQQIAQKQEKKDEEIEPNYIDDLDQQKISISRQGYHYRKSGYKTEKTSKLIDESSEFRTVQPKQEKIAVEKLNENLTKMRCHFRKSCYETGILPNLTSTKSGQIALEQQVDQDQKIVNCRYRKSCYETGRSPDTLNETKTEEKVLKVKPTTNDDLKMHCKYRKSCYLQTSEEIEWEKPIYETDIESTDSVGDKSYIVIRCNKYRLSCREKLGLEPKEKAPIGPNGKRLCRRKKPN